MNAELNYQIDKSKVDHGVNAVILTQDGDSLEHQPSILAQDILLEWFSDWANELKENNKPEPVIGWNTETNRSIQLTTASANVSAADPNFASIRQSLIIEAQLDAKAKIIESFLTVASAENVFTIPGNPIAQQVKDKQKAYDDQLASAEKAYKQAKASLKYFSDRLDKAVINEINGIGYNERLKALLDGIIKKIDKDFNLNNLSEEQAKKVERFKKAVSKAQEREQNALNLYSELEQAIANAKGKKLKELDGGIKTLSEMPLFGAVTLQQAESYDDLDEYLEVATIVVWSPQLELDARSILLGQGELKPRPAKRSLKDWVNNLDLSVSVGSRRYLARDGSINFIGIAAESYNPKDRTTMSFASKKAEMMAKQQAILSLFGDVSSYREMATKTVQKMGADGKSFTENFSSLSETISESVKNIRVRGLNIMHTERVTHPATGQSMIVAVANLDSSLAIKSPDLMTSIYATIKEINDDQSYIKGEIEGMRSASESSQNDPKAFESGKNNGSASVDSEYLSRNNVTETENDIVEQGMESGLNPASSNKVRSGAFLSGSDDIDDDF